jgi:hypothetical protein
MSGSVSPTLEIGNRDGARGICCRGCGQVMSKIGEPWKPLAQLQELPLQEAAGSAYRGSPDVRLRLFSCVGCGALLDSEIALAGEPFLEDIVNG